MHLKRNIKNIFPVVLVAGLLQACSNDPTHPGYEYMPDMYRSASYETYSENPNFEDGMSARTPVAGTVPRGFTPFGYPNNNEGYEAAGRELKNPLPRTEANIIEGERLFMIYCTYCHGNDGTGNGILVSNGKFPPPPSFSGPLRDLPEGKAYFTITYGKNLMGSHASQVLPDDRWKIIMFVQELQKGPATQNGTQGAAGADTTRAVAPQTTQTDTTGQQNSN